MKRISDVERITAFFQNETEGAINVMQQVIKQIVATRFKKEPKNVKPRKLKGSQTPSLLTGQGATQGGNAADS